MDKAAHVVRPRIRRYIYFYNHAASDRTLNPRVLAAITLIISLSTIGGYVYWTMVVVKPLPLKLGYLRLTNSAPYWVASEKGFFTDEGLNVSLIEFNTSTKIIEAIAAGRLDMGSASPLVSALAFANGIDLRIATDGGHTDQDHDGSFIVVAMNSTIRSVGDLKGKTVAISGWGTTTEMVFRLLLGKYNLTTADVLITILPVDKQYEALVGGRIDAAYLVEPFLTHALGTGDFRALSPTTSTIFPDHKFQISTTCFLSSFLDEHKDAVDAFIRAYTRALEWMNGHPDENAEIIAKYTGLEVGLVKRMHAYAYSSQLDQELVDRCLSLMWEQGLLSKEIKADEIVYTP